MIFITSYPYVGSRHIRVFDYFKKKADLVFILPKIWKMKGGQVVLKPIKSEQLKIIPAKAYFFHSRHFLIRGLLKGWMPALKRILRKMAHLGDVLYTANEPNLLVTYFNGRQAKKLGLKHVFFTWQNVRYEERLSGWKLKATEWLIRKNIALSDGAICGNEKAFNILKKFTPSNFKTLVSPISGVDTEQFRPGIISDFRKQYGLNDKIVLTFVGALDKRKGISTMINSFLAALSQEHRLHLVIIGAGSLESYIKDFINKNSLTDKITCIPWLENEKLPGILCSSDIFLYPSEPFGGWEEQFGYSIAEASSCGIPVISTNSGSIPDKVIDGTTGYLIQPGDQQQLTRSILSLSADPILRKNMGEEGRKFIIANFSHKVVAEKMEKFLHSL